MEASTPKCMAIGACGASGWVSTMGRRGHWRPQTFGKRGPIRLGRDARTNDGEPRLLLYLLEGIRGSSSILVLYVVAFENVLIRRVQGGRRSWIVFFYVGEGLEKVDVVAE